MLRMAKENNHKIEPIDDYWMCLNCKTHNHVSRGFCRHCGTIRGWGETQS